MASNGVAWGAIIVDWMTGCQSGELHVKHEMEQSVGRNETVVSEMVPSTSQFVSSFVLLIGVKLSSNRHCYTHAEH